MDFSFLPNIPTASPIAFGNWKEQHIQPKGNKECDSVKYVDSDWSESFGKTQVRLEDD
jgi:hypothetical protein